MGEDVLPRSFSAFLEPSCDRFAVLFSYLAELGLAPSAAEIAGSRHIVAAPGRTPFPSKPGIVLAAHYDRAPGSPGANDNSAAVFQLAAAARRLREAGVDGWLVVFTDREEAASGSGARGQGAYSLAEGFKAIGLGDARFFIFDACGRGDTIIVSTTVEALAEDTGQTRRAARDLRTLALETGRTAAGGRILLAPTPFSDDAGFLAAGLAAQTITLLPAREAAALAGALRHRPEYAAALINKKARDSIEPRAYGAFMPATWKELHGEADCADSLSPSAFPLMERFAAELVRRA
jgi:hypothetical protein